MVRLMMDTGKLKDYLTDLMELEVKRLGEEQEALLFRENSIGSKSIEAFLKLVCRNYLNETLQEVVRTVIDTADDGAWLKRASPVFFLNNFRPFFYSFLAFFIGFWPFFPQFVCVFY